MMLDFEDKDRGPPLSRWERAFIAFLGVLSIYGLVAQAATIWMWISDFFR